MLEDYNQQHITQSYMSFDDLPQLNITYQIHPQLAKSTLDVQDWQFHFQCINELRCLNKYDQQKMREQLEYENDQYSILYCMSYWSNSLRSNVQKNALILFKEIIQVNQIEQLSASTLVQFLSRVLDKLDSDYKFLRSEALAAIVALEQKEFNLYQKSLIEALLICTQNTINKVPLFSYPTLVKVLSRMPISEPLPQVWVELLRVTSLISEANKAADAKKSAEELIKFISRKGLWSASMDVLDKLGEQELKANLAVLWEKKVMIQPAAKTKSFKDFMALKKQESINNEDQQL